MISTTLIALSLFLQTPDTTLPPPTAHAQYTVVGQGVQIYRCTAQATAQPVTFHWVFQEPQADLFDAATHQPVGTHTTGPTWTWNDKSELVGKLLTTQPSPDPNAIPWLLLEAHSTGESGALSNIKFIRRSDTQAGAAPTSGCNAQHQDTIIRVPYQATYTFYSAN